MIGCFRIKWLVRYLMASLIKFVPWSMTMVNGHPNQMKMCSYNNLVITTIILMQIVGASPHFVA